jgi:hypothetical protein
LSVRIPRRHRWLDSSASLPIWDILFPLLISGRKPAERGLLRPFVRTTTAGLKSLRSGGVNKDRTVRFSVSAAGRLLRRITGLLYVSDRESGEARKRVLTRLGQ